MLNALLNVLNGLTDIPFVELAWSHSPDTKYGVITLDNQTPLNTGESPVSEKMLSGFVDVFIKKPQDLSTVNDVESALTQLGVWFALESVQFEDDTGYVHYEWRWRDSLGILFVRYRIVFAYNSDSGIKRNEQLVTFYETPTAPVVNDWHQEGLSLHFDSWNPAIVPAIAEATYNSAWRINVNAEDRDLVFNEDSQPFDAAQIQYIADEFPMLAVLVQEPNGDSYRATAVDYEGIEWGDGKSARWAV